MKKLKITVLGLTLTSSWGNGHATTYRALVKQLHALGHYVRFLERNVPWYEQHRDMPAPDYCELGLYDDTAALRTRYKSWITEADVVLTGSFVAGGTEIIPWLRHTAPGWLVFYDIDTPVTMAKLERGDYEYIGPSEIPLFDLYLSFSGGPVLELIRNRYNARMVRALYCSVDADLYFPEAQAGDQLDLGYLGTYSEDRQPALEKLLMGPARHWDGGRFAVIGAMYPGDIAWPANVAHYEHLSPAAHRYFYNSQRFTLNLTRKDMVEAGYSPSVRLFEAAACSVPIITDYWRGLEEFFEPEKEILVAEETAQVLDYLTNIDEERRKQIAESARQRVLRAHTAEKRTAELLTYIQELENTPQSNHFIHNGNESVREGKTGAPAE